MDEKSSLNTTPEQATAVQEDRYTTLSLQSFTGPSETTSLIVKGDWFEKGEVAAASVEHRRRIFGTHLREAKAIAKDWWQSRSE